MQDAAQNGTNARTLSPSAPEPVSAELLKYQQESWITFCALGGLMTYESDDKFNAQTVKQMTVTEFSQQTGVPRRTLYNWKQSIPHFAERVRMRRAEVFSLSRESTLFNRAYLIALTSKDHKAAGEMIKLLLGHFSQLELPAVRHEVEVGGGLADLLNKARERRDQSIQEGEVIDGAAIDA